MSAFCRRIARTEGQTLVETLVTAALVAIVGVGSLASVKYLHQGISTGRAVLMRDQLFNTVAKAALSPANLYYTATAVPGSPLAMCVRNGNPPGSCAGGTAIDFPLYSAPASGLAVGGLLSGTAGAPARYDLGGVPCTTASPSCAFEVSTSYEPICQGGAATCAQATQILVTVRVGQSAQVTVPTSTVYLATKVLNPPTPITTSEILLQGSKTCPGGLIFAGLDPYGTPICQNPPPPPPPISVATISGTLQRRTDLRRCNALNSPTPQNCHWDGAAACPAGYTATGGGGDCENGYGGTMLASRPTGSPANGWYVDCCRPCSNPDTAYQGAWILCVKE